jgi:hypothetical protein
MVFFPYEVIKDDYICVLALKMVFDLIAKKMISMEPAKSREFRKNFENFKRGMVCFPIYFPGTLFYKCMKVYIQMQISSSYVQQNQQLFTLSNCNSLFLLTGKEKPG